MNAYRLELLTEGDVVEHAGQEYIVTRIHMRKRHLRSIVATADGRPAHFGTRCTCAERAVIPTVLAIDPVVEAEYDVCTNCRFRRER